MHKKPLVAVLLFGLLLLLPLADSEARIDPGQQLVPDAELLPMIARGIVKDAPGSPTPITATPTNIQAGVSRTAATFCDGRWQGGIAFFVGGWFYGDEFYMAYQDPEELGSCAGLDDLYTFDVTAVNWYIFNGSAFAGLIHVQPLVFEDAGDISCSVPGGILCAGPLYEIDITGAGSVLLLGLPFDTECCVFDPYFAGVYFADFFGPGVIDVIIDDGGVNPQPACYVYNEYGSGPVDLNVDAGFGGNLVLWSEGNAFDQNNCPGTPGICDFQSYYDGIAFFWQAPNANAQNDYFVRYTADVSCTLVDFSFMAYCPGTEGTEPTYRVALWGPNGPVFGGRMYPQAFGVPFDALDPNLVEVFDLPFGSYNCFPDPTIVDFTDFPFGPGQEIIISVGLSDNTPDPGTDIASVLTDDGASPTGRSGSYVGVLSDWFYYDEVFSSDYDLLFDAYICCEQVDAEEVACSTPGPDDWSTFAHDYNRTSATTIEVGDPCEINPLWAADQDNNINFTQATVAQDRVYISNDQQARAYDLTTGALVNSVSGLPHVFSSNRGNMTVDGGFVYVTGGSGQSVGQWDYDLAVNNWVNGVGGDNPPLGNSVRFGAVVYIAGLDIIIVGDEGAQLWAFNAADGTLFGGWGTNPIALDGNALHNAAYDGTNLYVGTAQAGLDAGSIHQIDPATGVIGWSYSSGNGDGFPGGVSLEGDFIYASSSGLTGATGFRYKLNKADGSVVWSFGQFRGLYGPPAIGRNFVYFNLDGVDAGGIFAVDKNSGAPVYNFAADGVGRVPAHVTITCDNYVFAGDRNGKWWLLDVFNFVPVWGLEVPFASPVFGTAVSSNLAGDRNFAVLTTQFGGPTAGLIACYEFNTGPRPLVSQSVFTSEIGVEFGTGAGNPHSESGVFTNDGCADLNFTAITVADPLPDPTASYFSTKQSQYAAAVANQMVDANWNSYIQPGSIDKAQHILLEQADVENSRYDLIRLESRQTQVENVRNRSNRMAAGASALVRTSAITVTNPLPGGASTDVDWLYDGTGLERGVDVEIIEFTTDDPSRILLDNQPELQITYAGGCFPAFGTIHWNYVDEPNGVLNSERLYNTGELGDDTDGGEDLDWLGAGTQDVYSAAFFLAGEQDNVAVPPISQFHTGDINDNFSTFPEFLPDPFPGPDCEFQSDTDVPMGFIRTGGCPGTPVEVLGEWLRTAYVDTNFDEGRAGTIGEAIGTRIEVTEVGCYDPYYGDFKLMRFDVANRDAFDKGPIYAGSWYDWDVAPNFDANTGVLGLSYNGYGIYDHDNPDLMFGIFDPNLPTAYGGLNTAYNTPQRINPMGERVGDGDPSGNYDGPWQSPDADHWEEHWDYVVTRLPAFEDGPVDLINDASPYEDHAGLITLKGQILPASGSIAFHQALYAVDASSGDETTMEALGLALAQRAAKFAGFARGDVNDDNTVNLLDVCWLLSGNQIYPDTYNGDVDLSGGVDAADEAYLLNYVTGLGPAPLGDWRFTF